MANRKKVAAYHRRRQAGLAGKWKRQDRIVWIILALIWGIGIGSSILTKLGILNGTD